jgi:hypothetical protein
LLSILPIEKNLLSLIYKIQFLQIYRFLQHWPFLEGAT